MAVAKCSQRTFQSVVFRASDEVCTGTGHQGCLVGQVAFYESPASRCPLPELAWGPDLDGT